MLETVSGRHSPTVPHDGKQVSSLLRIPLLECLQPCLVNKIGEATTTPEKAATIEIPSSRSHPETGNSVARIHDSSLCFSLDIVSHPRVRDDLAREGKGERKGGNITTDIIILILFGYLSSLNFVS